MPTRSINDFVNTMKGGMAMSSEFEVSFIFPNDDLKSVVQGALSGVHTLASDDIITMFCNEAQLPNVSSLTGQTNGVYMGEGQVNYSYGKLFTDVSLGWYCDKNMMPLKFLQEWHNYQFYYGSEDKTPIRENRLFNTSLTRQDLVSRVKYPDDYQAKIIIKKTERVKDVDTTVMQYTLLDAFPHSIDATPLSYGSSQLVNVSANFYYSKFLVDYAARDFKFKTAAPGAPILPPANTQEATFTNQSIFAA